MKNKVILIMICAAIIFITGSEVSAQRKTGVRKTQNVRVEVAAGGYRPDSFRLKRGIPARVTFIRKTEDECGKEVIFPAYNIKRELPLNKPVTIAFTPRKTGSFTYACGMDMMQGKMIVQ